MTSSTPVRRRRAHRWIHLVTLAAVSAAAALSLPAAAGAATTLVQVDDAQFGIRPTTSDRRELVTSGDPYTWGAGVGTYSVDYGFEGSSLAFDSTYRWSNDIARFFCVLRDFCGRDSGQPGPGGGTFNRHFVTAAYGSAIGSAWYKEDEERIYVPYNAASNPGEIASAFGRQIDAVFGNDHIPSLEADEVGAALGEMFALDWEGGLNRPDVDHPTITEKAQSPAPRPSTYADYRCLTWGPRENAVILSRAYLALARAIGYPKSGHLLQDVPHALATRRTFGAVRAAFQTVVNATYGSSSAESLAVARAFNGVGVGLFDDRATKCPGAPQ